MRNTVPENQKDKVKLISHDLIDEDDIDELCSELPIYIKDGWILILKGMDKVYGLLQEILNMRYITRGNMEKSRLIYDDKQRDVYIGETFRCIVIQANNSRSASSEYSGEAYAPFQNRLEKQFMDYSAVMGPEENKQIKLFKELIESIFGKMVGQ